MSWNTKVLSDKHGKKQQQKIRLYKILEEHPPPLFENSWIFFRVSWNEIVFHIVIKQNFIKQKSYKGENRKNQQKENLILLYTERSPFVNNCKWSNLNHSFTKKQAAGEIDQTNVNILQLSMIS